MRSVMTRVLILCPLLLSLPALAQVYSWQDANGKTHFGDKIPKRYEKTGKAVPLKPSNAMPIKANNNAREPALKHVDIYPKKAKSNSRKNTSKSSACQKKIAEYERNSRCFASCRIGNNSYLNTRCVQLKGCKNMRKPHCD